MGLLYKKIDYGLILLLRLQTNKVLKNNSYLKVFNDCYN